MAAKRVTGPIEVTIRLVAGDQKLQRAARFGKGTGVIYLFAFETALAAH